MNVRAEMGSGSCGANLTWVLNDDGSLVISGTGAMNDYTGSAPAPWFAYISPVTSITLPVGLTYVGNYAFFHCAQVTSIVVPESVTMHRDKAWNKHLYPSFPEKRPALRVFFL